MSKAFPSGDESADSNNVDLRNFRQFFQVFFTSFFRVSPLFPTKMRIFYGDRQPNEDPHAFLTYLETCFAHRTYYTEEEKCESLACHLGAGSIVERWYDELKILTPKITNSWATLRKHFCVK